MIQREIILDRGGRNTREAQNFASLLHINRIVSDRSHKTFPALLQ